MNRDDIVRMARWTGLQVAGENNVLVVEGDNIPISDDTRVGAWSEHGWGHITIEDMERFANFVATEQREESAKLAQKMIDVEYMRDDFAKSIRVGMMRLVSDGRPKWLKDSMQVAAEREACAKVCDTLQQFGAEAMFGPYWERACVDCAEAIRARGNK